MPSERADRGAPDGTNWGDSVKSVFQCPRSGPIAVRRGPSIRKAAGIRSFNALGAGQSRCALPPSRRRGLRVQRFNALGAGRSRCAAFDLATRQYAGTEKRFNALGAGQSRCRPRRAVGRSRGG